MTTRKELHDALEVLNTNYVGHRNFYPRPMVNRNELLTNPSGDTVTVYERDGSDYEVYIKELTL